MPILAWHTELRIFSPIIYKWNEVSIACSNQTAGSVLCGFPYSFLIPDQQSLADSYVALITPDQTVIRLAFRSCSKQDQLQPIWKEIQAAKPQLFLYIGDNIYGDTDDMNVLKQKNQPGYKALRKSCKVIGTWDDHDYGRNDAGFEYPFKTIPANLSQFS